MIPKKPAPDLIRGGYRFSEKIMLHEIAATGTGIAAMPFRVSGKNLDIGEALRQRVNARLVEALEKYFDRGYSGHVTVEKDGFGFRTECAIHLDSGVTLESEAMAADAYASADQAAIRMEKQLRRYKRRLKDRQATRVDRPRR
jgi:ribosomal subunit interface protein